MALYIAQHEHDADLCPAKDPKMGAMLLQHLSDENAAKNGIIIQGKVVADHLHRLVLIVDAPTQEAVRGFMAPFAQAGKVEILPASTCESVVERGGCD